jgi:hypothetical protein
LAVGRAALLEMIVIFLSMQATRARGHPASLHVTRHLRPQTAGAGTKRAVRGGGGVGATASERGLRRPDRYRARGPLYKATARAPRGRDPGPARAAQRAHARTPAPRRVVWAGLQVLPGRIGYGPAP